MNAPSALLPSRTAAPLLATGPASSPVTSEGSAPPLVPTVGPRSRETPPEAAPVPFVGFVEFSLSGETGEAFDDLHHGLLLAKERGQVIPCQGPDQDDWTSEEPHAQDRAADACLDCPAIVCDRLLSGRLSRVFRPR